MNIPFVSVFILTYNQEQFIAQTLESILSQKTNFSFQLVIGDDYSIDSTRIICEKYEKDYGNKIKLLPNLGKNIGLIANYIRTIKECDGKYIAICDGDDYWIDFLKLQKQVDFLEKHVEFSIVYTKVKKLFPDGKFKDSVVIPNKSDSEFDDLIYDNFIPSVTALFRNNQNISELPSWICKYPYGDWPTYLWTIKDGSKIYFLNEITAVYRMDIGVSSKIRKVISDIIKINLDITQDIYNDVNFKHKRAIVKEALDKKNMSLMARFNRERSYFKAMKLFINNLKFILKNYKFTKIYLYSIYKSFS